MTCVEKLHAKETRGQCYDLRQKQVIRATGLPKGGRSQIFENSQIGLSRHCNRPPKHIWPKSWSSIEDPVVPLERNLYGHLLTRLFFGKGNFGKFYWNTVGRRYKLGMLICHRSTKTILISVCGRYQTGRQDRRWNRHGGFLWQTLEDVDLREPTSFFDHVYLVCTQREWQTSNDIVGNYRNRFESRTSAGATEKLPYSEKLGAKVLHGPMMWKVTHRNA